MRRSPARLAFAFLLLFAVYQSTEGVGDRLLHSFPVQAGLMLAAVLIAWPLGRWLGYSGYDAFGLDLKPRSLGLLAAMLLTALGAKAVALVAGVQTGTYALAAAAIPSVSAVAMLAFSTFIPSIAEDILTRGFFLRAADPGWNGAVFVIFSATVFTLNHIYRFDAGWTEQARLFAMGLAYAAAAWRWQTLWAAVGLHWGYNLANALAEPMTSLTGDAVQGRWLTIAVHLGLLAMVLLIPAKPRDARRA